jgi:excisionase family DNA binding protein
MDRFAEEGRIRLDGHGKRGHLMSPAELQAWLGCGRTKVYELLQSNEIRSYRIGRLVRVRREDVEEFLERNRYDAEE